MDYHSYIMECTSIKPTNFYRATLCILVFAVVRCPSVRLSVTLVYCVETAKLTIKLFSLTSF